MGYCSIGSRPRPSVIPVAKQKFEKSCTGGRQERWTDSHRLCMSCLSMAVGPWCAKQHDKKVRHFLVNYDGTDELVE